MKRVALIITNPGQVGEEGYCNGVNRDLDNYQEFLRSPIGGLWEASEIETLHRPRASEVRIEMQRLKGVDYSLVIFCGHGCHVRGPDSTVLELNDKQAIDSMELMDGSPKQTVILDCCRVVREVPLREAMLLKAKRALPELNLADCRYFYDKRIQDCANAIVVMYACSIGEVAGDASDVGGWYSSNLLHGVRLWAENRDTDTKINYAIMSMVRAHEAAADDVRRRSGNRQRPEISKPRSEPYFPLCIVA